MPLQGTFDVLDFSEVLRLLARQQLTGRLHVRSRSFAANLFFDEGALVGADQSEHQAAATAGDVRGRLEEICFEMLDAERGGFEFQAGRPSTLPAATRLRVDTVLSRARKRLQEWQELQELIPSLDLQPHLVDDLASTEVTIDQERWRMLTAIDGRRSLRAIGRTLNMSDFDVCRVVKALLDGGVVEIDARAAALASAARDAVAPAVPLSDTQGLGDTVRVTGAEEQPSSSAPLASRSVAERHAVTTGTRSLHGTDDAPEAAAAPTAVTPGLELDSAGDVTAHEEDANGAPQVAAGTLADPDQPGDDAAPSRRRRVVRIRSRVRPDDD